MVNEEIWDLLSRKNRSVDLAFQRVQEPLIHGLSSLTILADRLFKDIQSTKTVDAWEILTHVMDSIPVSGTLLQPRHSTEGETRAMMGMKRRQQHFYDKHTKPLQPIEPGQTVRMKLPGNSTWTAGTCIGEVGPRSYKVLIGDSIYRRNRRQLISPRNDDHQASPDRTPGDQTAPEDLETQLTPSGSSQETNLPSEPVETPMQQSSLGISSPRRSSRSCHPPSWTKDYVMT